MQRDDASNPSALPPELFRSTPRPVRVNAVGVTVMSAAMVLTAVGVWGEIALYTRANAADRHVTLFEQERIVTGAQVIQGQRRGGGLGRRVTVYYQYAVHGKDYTGATLVRGADGVRYVEGSPVAVWYLPSQPYASWLDGYGPSLSPLWPAIAVPAAFGLGALSLIVLLRRQLKLLTHGQPAMAAVTNVETKREGMHCVHYEWTLSSGEKRQGRYKHGKKLPPAVGDTIPIVYDQGQPSRNSRYPLGLVSIVRRGR